MSTKEKDFGNFEPHLISEKLDTGGGTNKMSFSSSAPSPPVFAEASPSSSTNTMNTTPTNGIKSKQDKKTKTKTKKNPPKSLSKLDKFLSILKTLLLDIPLALLFALFITVYILHDVHYTIFLPFLNAAVRTDKDLEEEFTYYDRTCSASDLTTFTPSDLILNNKHTTPAQAVNAFMTYGGVILPEILDADTIQQLRKHVQERNANLTQVEEIELSQGYNRKSFAFDASEDPIVSKAIQQVACHSLLKDIMSTLMGDEDPAVSEITAITAYYGCPDQAWHQDVKADGSPLKYGRTFVHSHSLFIPLQDTFADMGATSFCPGSHYCANDDGMADVCQEYGFQLSEARDEGVWKAGDAALLSQHVWHRGAKHTSPNAPERIVFVMTFLARPDLTRDRRQLSRGTYFHMRWNMWGHTFQDLLDAEYSMAKPFSILRSLGLWKPFGRNWGFDLVTSGLLRCANNQMGMTSDELQVFVDTVMTKLHIPTWLQGPVTEQEDAWQVYLKTTLDESLLFLATMNTYVLAVYFILVVMTALIRKKTSVVTKSVWRLVLTHGVLLLIGHSVMQHIYHSPLATDLRAKRLLMRAFPTEQDAIAEDESIPSGPLTLPERDDVLVGSRFDARFLGAFDRWLDYHPGNKMFRARIADNAKYYKDYSGLPAMFRQEIIHNIESETIRRGRFLSQDYRQGLWSIMSDSESHEYVRQTLAAASSDVLTDLNQEIAYMLADYRFGLKRDTVMARVSQEYLLHWRNDLLFPSEKVGPALSQQELVILSSSFTPAFSITLAVQPLTFKASSNTITPIATNNSRWTDIPPPQSSFQVGDVVMVLEESTNRVYRGSIMNITKRRDKYVVSYEDGGTDRVEESELHPLVPIQEGTRVFVDFGDEGWFEGTVVFVHPNRDVDVEYDDGDFDEALPYWRYQVVIDGQNENDY